MPNLNSPAQEHIRVLIIAPVWHQNVLNLWLQVTGEMTFVTCTTSLGKIKRSTDIFATAYDWVILSTHSPNVCLERDIPQIQERWSTTHLIVLAHDEHVSGSVADTNPDIIWIKSDTPTQLVKALASISNAKQL